MTEGKDGGLSGTEQARALARMGRRADALRLTTDLLRADGGCPYLLVLRSRLIQVDESDSTLTLEDAENCLLAAVRIDPTYLAALEDLAHYYDAVAPDRAKARLYASQFLEQVNTQVLEMERIQSEVE